VRELFTFPYTHAPRGVSLSNSELRGRETGGETTSGSSSRLQANMATPWPSARIADPTWSMLDSFSLDQLPQFTRTVLNSSPVLVLPNREGALYEPGGSYRGSFATSSTANPPATLIRHSTSMTTASVADLDEFPPSLQLLVRLHKRKAFDLFRKWEAEGRTAVSVNVFAEGVRAITSEQLSDDDLLTVLKIVDHMRGDEMLVGERWRSRTLDCKRLWRKLANCAAKQASGYIRESSSPSRSAWTKLALGGEALAAELSPASPKIGVSWSSMLEQKADDQYAPSRQLVLEEPPTAAVLETCDAARKAAAVESTVAPPPAPPPVVGAD